jgi:hypothetical protein
MSETGRRRIILCMNKPTYTKAGLAPRGTGSTTAPIRRIKITKLRLAARTLPPLKTV